MSKSRLKKVTGIAFNCLLYIFLSISIFSVILTVMSRKNSDGSAEMFGYQMRIVTTDSMAECKLTDVSKYKIKSIPVRSMIFVKTVPSDEAEADAWYSRLKVGDVLTFRYVYVNQVTITHRITSITEKAGGGYVIELAGDNKNSDSNQLYQTIDTSISDSPNYVIGKVTGQSIALGFITSLTKTPFGIILIISVPCFIVILLEIIKIVSAYGAQRKRRAEEDMARKDSELLELRQRLEQLEKNEAGGVFMKSAADSSACTSSAEEAVAVKVSESKSKNIDSSFDTLENWRAKIKEREASGLTVEEWCKKEGISKNTYYYRMKKVKESQKEENSQ